MRERDRDRETDRERQRDRETETDRDRETETERQRQRETQRERERERERERGRKSVYDCNYMFSKVMPGQGKVTAFVASEKPVQLRGNMNAIWATWEEKKNCILSCYDVV